MPMLSRPISAGCTDVLEISGLQAGYGGSVVLEELELMVSQGELVTVIGPNGAGKSTLLRTISGLVRPQRGRVLFEGEDIGQERPDRIVRRGIVHVPEGRMVLGRMSVQENLLLGAFATRKAATGADLDAVLALFPRLQERLGQLAGTLSGGEQQMLAIGRGLMSRPRLLMLDEPSLGIAPIIVERIFEALESIRANGVTVLLVEQNAARALAAADRGYALEMGRVTASGPSRALLADDRVRRAYLGI